MSDKTNPTQSGRGILRRWRIAGIGLASAIALAGCNGTPGGEPTVTPATSILPSITATPTPSDDAEALFKEAEAVYREYFTELQKLEAAGGADELPPEIGRLLTKQRLQEETAIFRKAKGIGYRTAPGEQSTLIGPWQSRESIPGSDVTLESCQDERHVTILDRNSQPLGKGSMVRNRTGFVREGDSLKIFTNTPEPVTTCEPS